MMRKELAMALLATVTLHAEADDYNYLTFQKSDGVAVSLPATGLTMTFADGVVTVTSGSETATFNLSELDKMFFGNEKMGTGISTVNGDANLGGTVSVYSASGVFMGQYDAGIDWQQQLSHGVYIIKGGEKAQKIVIR